jgi:hypothetical protein
MTSYNSLYSFKIRSTCIASTNFSFLTTASSKQAVHTLLYLSSSFQQCVARLQYMVKTRSFGLVTGEIGAGKSTAIRSLRDGLDLTKYQFIYLCDSSLKPRDFVDNGAIYSSHHFARICGRLRNQLKHTRPGCPQGRGKQEKFFRFVDLSFVPEAYDLMEQGKIQTLSDLNRFFAAWLEVAYHQKIHNSFKQRPVDRYRKCDHPIRMVPPHELMEVFLLEETRKVDNTNCVSLLGTTYEVEPGLVGEKVAYLVVFLDDYSRYVVHAQFYFEERGTGGNTKIY